MKYCIVNYIDKLYYKSGQERLKESLINVGFPEKDIFLFNNASLLIKSGIGCPSHKEIPYAFKLSCIEYVRRLGYQKVLWLDASVWVCKPLDKIWDWMDNHDGFYMDKAGGTLDRFCNNNGLKILNINREDAKKVDLFKAGLLGLDFSKKNTLIFFSKWLKTAKLGGFNGSWVKGHGAEGGHRHDQSMGSGIIYNMYGNKCSEIVTSTGLSDYVGTVYGKKSKNVILCIRHLSNKTPKHLWYSDD